MTGFEKCWNKECKNPTFFETNAKFWCELFYTYGQLDQLKNNSLKNQIKKDFDTLLQQSNTAYMFETIEKISQKYGVTIHTFGGKKKHEQASRKTSIL